MAAPNGRESVRCDYCGDQTSWFDSTGSPACRRGHGCAQRPDAHSRTITLPSGRARTLYLLRGEWLTIADLARRAALPLHVVSRRLRRGWNVDDAVRPEVDTMRARARARGVSDRAMRLALLSAALGDDPASKPATLVSRSQRAPRGGRPERVVVALGESLTMRDWAARLGVSRSAIYGLAERRGVSVEVIIEQRLRAMSAHNDDGRDRGDEGETTG